MRSHSWKPRQSDTATSWGEISHVGESQQWFGHFKGLANKPHDYLFHHRRGRREERLTARSRINRTPNHRTFAFALSYMSQSRSKSSFGTTPPFSLAASSSRTPRRRSRSLEYWASDFRSFDNNSMHGHTQIPPAGRENLHLVGWRRCIYRYVGACKLPVRVPSFGECDAHGAESCSSFIEVTHLILKELLRSADLSRQIGRHFLSSGRHLTADSGAAVNRG